MTNPFDFYQRSVHEFESYNLKFFGSVVWGFTYRSDAALQGGLGYPFSKFDRPDGCHFFYQDIAVTQMLIEAKLRVKEQERDGSEYFEDQLLEAMKSVQSGE